MKESVDKIIYINTLIDFYGDLLSERQRKIIIDYYEENLSLSEIAENDNISRNAVYDALKKGEEALLYFESVLHLSEKRDNYISVLERLKNENKIDEDTFNLLKGE